MYFFVCRICLLGDRLLALDKIRNNDTGELECNKYQNGSIYSLYCGDRFTSDPETGEEVPVTAENDEYCQYFHDHNVSLRPGIPGLASGVFISEFLCVASPYLELPLILLPVN